MTGLSRRATVLLAGIITCYLALGTLYALKVPLWNAPDEPSHYNYVRFLAETRQLPILQMGDYDQALLERLKASRFPPNEPIASIRYESHQPPLYYALCAIVYAPFSGSPTPTGALALRFFSVVLGALSLLASAAVFRLLDPKDEAFSLAATALMAFLPMRLGIYSSINNDVLAELVMSLGLVMLLWRWGQERSRSHLLLLGLVVGAALLTKVMDYLLLALVPIGLLMSERDRVRTSGGSLQSSLSGVSCLVARQSALVYLMAAVVGGWWFARNLLIYGWPDAFGLIRHDAVVIGQPTTGAVTPEVAIGLLVTLFRSFWGQFGWMGVLMDNRVYLLLALLSGLSGLGLFLWFLGELRSPVNPRGYYGKLTLLAITIVVVFAGVVQYNLHYIQAQGRYLYPALAPVAAFGIIGVRELLAEKHRALLLGLLLAGLCVLDVMALYLFILPALAT